MAKKILVTGGAGYVGSSLVPMLLEGGYIVRVYDNLTYGGQTLIPLFRNPRFEFVRGDIRDSEKLRESIEEADVIVHLAAIVGYPACEKWPDVAQEVNVEAVRRMTGLIRDDQTVIYASTGSNYGAVTDGICTEDTPLNPLTLYGVTKTEAEKVLLSECRTVAYRFATAFGLSPRMRLDLLINDFVHKAQDQRYLVLYQADFMRTFIHVHDMARAFVFGLEHADDMVGEVYNVGSDSMNYSKRDVCELIRQKIDYYLHVADVGADKDQRNYMVAYNKISKLGYDTTVSVAQGIDELIRGFQVMEAVGPYSNV